MHCHILYYKNLRNSRRSCLTSNFHHKTQLIVRAPAVIWVNTNAEQSECLCFKVNSRWSYRSNAFIYLHTFTRSRVKPASLGLFISLLVPVQMFDLDCVFRMRLCVVTCVKWVGWDLFEAVGRQDCSCGSVCFQRRHFYINIVMVVCRWAHALSLESPLFDFLRTN